MLLNFGDQNGVQPNRLGYLFVVERPPRDLLKSQARIISVCYAMVHVRVRLYRLLLELFVLKREIFR